VVERILDFFNTFRQCLSISEKYARRVTGNIMFLNIQWLH
jgi:hypothetical protein